MPQKPIQLRRVVFPLKGVTENAPYHSIPDGYTHDALNVRPFDIRGRMRGAQRPGTARAIAQQVNGENPITRMGQITLNSGDPLDVLNESWTWGDDLHDAGSGVNGDGPGGGWLRFPPFYYEGTDWPTMDPLIDLPDSTGTTGDTVTTLEAGTLS